MIYENKQIIIKPFDPNTVNDQYKSWFNNFEITQYTSHCCYPKSSIDIDQFKSSCILSKDNIVWNIFVKESKPCSEALKNYNIKTLDCTTHIGNCSLQQIDLINRSAEVAIIIGEKEYHGKGIGTECFKWMFEHGFNRLGLHRIYAGTAEYNKGMINVCAKSGMLLERVAREALFINGQFQNCIYYSILRSEWDELQKREER